MRQNEKSVSPMSNEGRNAYVIEHITGALLKLLREKPIEAISVSELCELAGIGRASFYRNYDSKEDILRAYIHALFREWTAESSHLENRPLSEFLRALFANFEKHWDFYELLNRRNLICLLKDVIIGFCGPQPENSKEVAYARAYVSYALYGWIEVWFQRGNCGNVSESGALTKTERSHCFSFAIWRPHLAFGVVPGAVFLQKTACRRCKRSFAVVLSMSQPFFRTWPAKA